MNLLIVPLFTTVMIQKQPQYLSIEEWIKQIYKFQPKEEGNSVMCMSFPL